MKKDDILAKLKALPFPPGEYWLVSGAAMVLYGIKEETPDIDLGCTPELADRLEKDGCFCEVTPDGNRRFRIDDETEVFENWLFYTVDTREGIPVISIAGLREMKRRLGREKDKKDLERIEEYLKRRK